MTNQFLPYIGVVFFMLGIILLVLTGVYALPDEWRIYGLVATTIVSLVIGVVVFIALSRHLSGKPLAFDQSLAEIKKDMTCLSTKN